MTMSRAGLSLRFCCRGTARNVVAIAGLENELGVSPHGEGDFAILYHGASTSHLGSFSKSVVKYRMVVASIVAPHDVVHTLQVGPFESLHDADQLCELLKTVGGMCFVARN
jgi:hypothetical protein